MQRIEPPALSNRTFHPWAVAALGVFVAALPACAAPGRPAAKPKEAPQESPKNVPKQQPDDAPDAQAKDGEFIEYRYLPEFGQIVFSDHAVRGAKGVKYLKQHADDLAKRGVYAFADESKRHVYRQSQKIGDRLIESAVVVNPPTGQGDDGDAFTARLLVKVDGRKKIDCTIGTTADGELWVSRVVVHADDGTVEMTAVGGDGEELNIPEAQESLDDHTCITDDSFYQDDPAEPGGPGPVKA